MATFSLPLAVLALLGSWADERPAEHTWLRIQVFARVPPGQEAAGAALKALGWCEGRVGLLAPQLCELQPLCEYQ